MNVRYSVPFQFGSQHDSGQFPKSQWVPGQESPCHQWQLDGHQTSTVHEEVKVASGDQVQEVCVWVGGVGG